MTDRLSDTDLAEMKERADKATEGPWEVESFPHRVDIDGPHGGWLFRAGHPDAEDFDRDMEPGDYEQTHTDALFIARARSDVPALAAEVEALRADNEKQKAEYDRVGRWINGYKAEQEEIIGVWQRTAEKAIADRDRLLALLDPDNDEAVEAVENAIRTYGDGPNVLRALRDAAKKEAGE